MGFLLLLVVLVPTLGMAIVAAIAASGAVTERDAASQLQEDAASLAEIVEARAALSDEEVVSAVLTTAADLGIGAEALGELYGIDYESELADARAAVDADPVLSVNLTLAASLEEMRSLRPGIDAGTVPFGVLLRTMTGLRADIDRVWSDRFDQELGEASRDRLPITAHTRLDALDAAYHALAAGSGRTLLAIEFVLGDPTTADRTALLDATSRYDAAVEAFARELGPRSAEAWQQHTSSAAARRFERTLDDMAVLAVTGDDSPLSSDAGAFGDAFIDGTRWATGLTDTVRAAAADLRDLGVERVADANRDLRYLLLAATLLIALPLGGAVLLARIVTRPIGRLEAAAHQIHEGRFDLPPLEVRGPRELSDTAAAFNDMASTLSAVEAHAVALADDPDAPLLADPLPGRTGRALQVALNRLRRSIQMAERHRQELQRAATHDDLTGLLNRPAAIEVLERDLSRVTREGGAVAAMFIDLDGLKAINDAHGHAAGDDALRLVAEALKDSTRASDVVARLSGDEFLVSGVVHDMPDEIEALAERVHQAISEQVLICAEEQVAIRCSVGVAVSQGEDSAHSLIGKADNALYEAKRQGRNRIAWHPHPQMARGSDRG